MELRGRAVRIYYQGILGWYWEDLEGRRYELIGATSPSGPTLKGEVIPYYTPRIPGTTCFKVIDSPLSVS